jgi:hypothetical protein
LASALLFIPSEPPMGIVTFDQESHHEQGLVPAMPARLHTRPVASGYLGGIRTR